MAQRIEVKWPAVEPATLAHDRERCSQKPKVQVRRRRIVRVTNHRSPSPASTFVEALREEKKSQPQPSNSSFLGAMDVRRRAHLLVASILQEEMARIHEPVPSDQSLAGISATFADLDD